MQEVSRTERSAPTSRLAQKEDTRRRLLAAGRSLFRASGVDTVSMEDIAQAANVSRATIYLHFQGKSALLEALLEEDWGGQVRLFECLGMADILDKDRLHEWVMRVAEGMVRARDSFVIHRAALGQNPDLTVRHQRHRERLARSLVAAAGRNIGEAGTDLRRDVEAELMVAELEYFATAAALGWKPAQVSAAAEMITGRLRNFAGVAD